MNESVIRQQNENGSKATAGFHSNKITLKNPFFKGSTPTNEATGDHDRPESDFSVPLKKQKRPIEHNNLSSSGENSQAIKFIPFGNDTPNTNNKSSETNTSLQGLSTALNISYTNNTEKDFISNNFPQNTDETSLLQTQDNQYDEFSENRTNVDLDHLFNTSQQQKDSIESKQQENGIQNKSNVREDQEDDEFSDDLTNGQIDEIFTQTASQNSSPTKTQYNQAAPFNFQTTKINLASNSTPSSDVFDDDVDLDVVLNSVEENKQTGPLPATAPSSNLNLNNESLTENSDSHVGINKASNETSQFEQIPPNTLHSNIPTQNSVGYAQPSIQPPIPLKSSNRNSLADSPQVSQKNGYDSFIPSHSSNQTSIYTSDAFASQNIKQAKATVTYWLNTLNDTLSRTPLLSESLNYFREVNNNILKKLLTNTDGMDYESLLKLASQVQRQVTEFEGYIRKTAAIAPENQLKPQPIIYATDYRNDPYTPSFRDITNIPINPTAVDEQGRGSTDHEPEFKLLNFQVQPSFLNLSSVQQNQKPFHQYVSPHKQQQQQQQQQHPPQQQPPQKIKTPKKSQATLKKGLFSRYQYPLPHDYTTYKVFPDLLTKSNEEEDDDLIEQSMILSLLDPLSGKRLETPLRSRFCSHIECFDMSSFIEMNRLKPFKIGVRRDIPTASGEPNILAILRDTKRIPINVVNHNQKTCEYQYKNLLKINRQRNKKNNDLEYFCCPICKLEFSIKKVGDIYMVGELRDILAKLESDPRSQEVEKIEIMDDGKWSFYKEKRKQTQEKQTEVVDLEIISSEDEEEIPSSLSTPIKQPQQQRQQQQPVEPPQGVSSPTAIINASMISNLENDSDSELDGLDKDFDDVDREIREALGELGPTNQSQFAHGRVDPSHPPPGYPVFVPADTDESNGPVFFTGNGDADDPFVLD